jgi:perosamine synthetase
VGDGLGSLTPVCSVHVDDAELIEALAAWRERNMAAYPTQFPVSVNGTSEWLRERVLAVPDRVMFLVTEPGGRLVGHAGFADALNEEHSVRVDNVMRGVDGGPPGMMSMALLSLLVWVRETVAPRIIWVKVFSDNERAIRFFRRLGFRDESLIALRRQLRGQRLEYVQAGDMDRKAARHHLRMTLASDAPMQPI